MTNFPSRSFVEAIKTRYPIGTRLMLESMSGEPDMPIGLTGVIQDIDDIGQLHMKWENGRSLALVPGTDNFHVIP